MANTMITARRKLTELYRSGVEVRFGVNEAGERVGRIGPFKDEDGVPIPRAEDEISVWVQAPSPLNREMALRDAQAARAKALVRAKRDEESEEYLTSKAFLVDMTDETLIEYVLLGGQDERQNDAIREILADKEWEDITAYRDALRKFQEDQTPEDDPDYAALLELDKKFSDQVHKRAMELEDAEREVLAMQGRDRTEKKALEKRAEVAGSQAFMHEYEQQMLFYAIRDFEHKSTMFFESPRELADMPDEFKDVIKSAMAPFINDVAEAKNSQGAVSGSESSEPPSKPETSEASTPPAATE